MPFGSPSAYRVVVYFAHRIPDNGYTEIRDAARQAAFVAAVQLPQCRRRFCVVSPRLVFSAGKEGILDLIGATASGAVPWDTINGQNVIDVWPGHFITTNGLTYPSTVNYSDVPRGVPLATYPSFNNTPDERYPVYNINPSAGFFRLLFASDYSDAGTTHLLGFIHKRATWLGRVVGYQPAEYQPNALDVAGPNFQILANAIVHAAGAAITRFHTLSPCRLVDTRAAQGPALAAGTTRTFTAGGVCGVPVSARALSVNLTVVTPDAAGALVAFAGGSPVPPTSTLSYGATQTRASMAIAALGEGSDISVNSAQAAGSAHVVVDVNGYFE